MKSTLLPNKDPVEIFRSQKDKMNSLMEGLVNIDVGLDIVGLDYRILFQNQILKRRFGDLTSKLCYESYMGLNKPCPFCPMVKAIRNNRVEKAELTGIDGRNYELIAAPFQNPDGTVDKVMELVIDITDRKERERKLSGLNRELNRLNRKLQRLSLKDPLTSLYNHRYLAEIIESEFYRAKAHNQPLSLMMMDIDYFKSINDVYGHRFGDLVLKQFAKKLRKLARLHDYVIRFGGEEFIVILPACNGFDALKLGQRISDSIKIHRFGDSRNMVEIRLSCAVVSYPEDDIFKAGDFIESAEQILDKVKECGGDRVWSFLNLKKKKFSLDEEVADIGCMRQKLTKLTKQANQSLIESIFAFTKTLELKDHYTGNHVEHTVYYATEIARKLHLSDSDILLIGQASMLHDLGKIGISEKILLKRGRLTKGEFDKIKEHPKIGVDIIRPIQLLHGLIPLILYHHERWDGKGYPYGIKAREIPIGARIIAIADVYQALISDRPYRKALSKETAIKIIKENSGSQFDPMIVSAFLEIVEKR